MNPLPIIENAPIYELPPYLEGYESCVVIQYCYKPNGNTLKRVTITSDETVFLRNLYRKHLTSGLPVPPDKPDLAKKVLQLERKGLVVKKEDTIFLSKNAYDAEYTLIPRAIPEP